MATARKAKKKGAPSKSAKAERPAKSRPGSSKGRAKANAKAKAKTKSGPAVSPPAGQAEQPVVSDALKERAEDAGQQRADNMFEEALGTGVAPKAVPVLNPIAVREWVRQIAGNGRATDAQRRLMEPIYKEAFEAQWRSLAK
ncbi:MAG: hypothetical protein ACRENE_15500 [Polyangiaceae bacterium]